VKHFIVISVNSEQNMNSTTSTFIKGGALRKSTM
jgi:hypothetical protein